LLSEPKDVVLAPINHARHFHLQTSSNTRSIKPPCNKYKIKHNKTITFSAKTLYVEKKTGDGRKEEISRESMTRSP